MKDSFVLGTHRQLNSESPPLNTQTKRSNILNIKNASLNMKQKPSSNGVHCRFKLTKTVKPCKIETAIDSPADKSKSLSGNEYPNSRNKGIKCHKPSETNYLNVSLSPLIKMTSQIDYNYSSIEQLCHSNNNSLQRQIPRSSKKPRLLLMPSLKDKGTVIEQKQTEADTSYDKVKSNSHRSSLSFTTFKRKVSSEERRPKSNNKYKKLPNIPEDRSSFSLTQGNQKRISSHVLIPQKNNIFKLFFRQKGSISSKGSKNAIYYNKTMNNEDNVFDDSSNSIYKANDLSCEDYNCSSDSGVKLLKCKTSKGVSKTFVHKQKKAKRMSYESTKCYNSIFNKRSRYFKKAIDKSQLIPLEHLSAIDAKCNIVKLEAIQNYCFLIEKKVDAILNQLPGRRNDSQQSQSSCQQKALSLRRLIETLKSSNNHHPKIHVSYPNHLNIKLSSNEIRILFGKYDNLLYDQILTNYLCDNKRIRQSLMKMANTFENKLKINKHLEVDSNLFISYHNTLNIHPPQLKSKVYHSPLVNRGIHLGKKAGQDSSLVFVNGKCKSNRRADNEHYSLLQEGFYSREDFDVENLKQITKKLELVPRWKAKNVDFRIVDEQEEMKKNKNMSKESLVFRTQEIKLKIKERLETIEEILFFLIKEINFKEFKKLLEQFQMPLESRDEEGNTLLIFAVECSFMECIVYLIQRGACLNAQNNALNTPLHVALLYKNFEIADILLKHGADEKLLNRNHLTPWQCLSI